MKIVTSNNRREKFLSEAYGYCERPFWFLVGLLPPLFRIPIYKLIFKEFGKNIFIGEKCYFRYPWKISIGDNSGIGANSKIYPSFKIKDSFIHIGNNVMIAPNVTMYGAGHPVNNSTAHHLAENIQIEDDVYIGGGVIIRYGVTVGRHAIVAAGSVVVKDVERNSVVGGNPAKQLRVLG